MFNFGGDPSAAVGVRKDELTIAAGKVTPGVDDTPYIQYAIQALTRGRETPVSTYGAIPEESDDEDDEDHPHDRRMMGEEAGYGRGGYAPVPAPQRTYGGQTSPRRQRRSRDGMPLVDNRPRTGAAAERRQSAEPAYNQQPLLQQPLGNHHGIGPEPDRWVPVTKQMRENSYPNDRTYPPLTFKPRILRPFSMVIFMILCILMTAALIFSAIYADQAPGLAPYPGTIYSGQYFVFRLLPQLLAAIILIYAQSIVSTSLRILPFTALASEDARKRYLALFQKLYPTSFFWPRLVGPWQVKAFSLATWLSLFTLPLQSAVFTCILVDRQWTWSPVVGVIWTLVAIYIILVLATGCLMVFWFRQWTGLAWDIRSLGDLIPLLNRSNTTHSYKGTDSPEAGRHLKSLLRDRWFDRLGYWRAEDSQTGGLWYSIGSSGTHAARDAETLYEIMGKRASYDPSFDSHDLANPTSLSHSRYSHLPWFLRNGPMAASVVAATAVLLAVLVLSFLPQTRLADGFSPLLPAKPDTGSFSAANFLYSFLPSLVGMLPFLHFQAVDLALRLVQPWGDLSRQDGAAASKSILADYTACLPLHSTLRAAKAGHWRVAITSLMAVLFVAIPILAGGLFMALTIESHNVRMFTNVPVFGVFVSFLILYAVCLFLVLPGRRQFLLPHDVACLAEMISFASADELTQDAAFRAVRSREDLAMRLGAEKRGDPREETIWHFGCAPGKDEKRLSIRRLKRFTEKGPVRAMTSMV